MPNLKNIRHLVCDGNEMTCISSRMITMENFRLITAKKTWLLPQLAQDECSAKPPASFYTTILPEFPIHFQKLPDLLTVQTSKYQWKQFLHKLSDLSKTLLFKYLTLFEKKTTFFSIYPALIHVVLIRAYIQAVIVVRSSFTSIHLVSNTYQCSSSIVHEYIPKNQFLMKKRMLLFDIEIYFETQST